MNISFDQALANAKTQKELTRSDIVALLSADEDQSQLLFDYANQVRKQAVGDEVELRGIIEFSNYCRQQCTYCGLRAGNQEISRYRLRKNEILQAAQTAVDSGYKTLVLQSGEDPLISDEWIAEITKEIKAMDVAITLSCGQRSYETYKLWRQAGADRYLIKQETADAQLYKTIRPGNQLETRLQCQRWLKQLDYQVGSGCMIGIPGQTIETLAADLLLMKEMEIDMSGMGPFIPHPQTPLKDGVQGTAEMTFKMIATARILMPQLLLPATTSLASIHPQGRELALQVGANVIMPNVSPQQYRKLYEIYPNKLCIKDQIGDYRHLLTAQVESLGRTISSGYGHSLKYIAQHSCEFISKGE